MDKKKIIGIILSAIAIVAGCLIPGNSLFTAEALRYAGVFAALLILLVTKPVPDWAASLLCCCLLVCLKVGKVATVFSAFSGSTIWLIIMVFAFAAALSASGLLTRIALKILTFFPATYNGAVLALMTAGTIMNPMIPSVNAKCNILLPVATAVTEQVGLKERSKGALGLFSACHLPTFVAGNAFLSGSVYVAIMIGFITDRSFDLISWFVATCVWFAIIMIGAYLFCTVYCKPEEKLEISKDFYKERYAALGRMTRNEKITGVVLLCTLAMWCTSSIHGIDSGVVGLIAIVIFVASGIFGTADWVTRVPWSMITFIGCIMGVAGLMSETGLSNALATVLGPILSGFVGNPWIFVPVLVIFSYLARFVIIDQLSLLVMCIAIFTPLMDSVGMSLFIPIFVNYMSSNTWNNPVQGVFVVASVQVAGGKYVTFEDTKKSSVFFMIINLIAMVASIPLWQMLGLC